MKLNLIVFALVGVVQPHLSQADSALKTFAVKRVLTPLEYEVDGTVEARRQAALSAEVSGQVEAVYFDVNDWVEKGQVVVKIRDKEYRAQLKKANAALDGARAAKQDAGKNYHRSKNLLAQKLISQSLFDTAKARLNGANARQNAATASVAEASEQLARTRLRAPYSGVVVERLVEPGEMTRPGQKVMIGYSREQLRVITNVPQSLIEPVRKLGVARVERLNGGGAIAVEKMIIHPFADSLNHSFPVRLDLRGEKISLSPGMLVHVAFAIGQRGRLLVPRQALVYRSEVNAVYLVKDDGRISFRQVRPGNAIGDQIELLAGIDENERVALDPVRAGIRLKAQQAAVGK